MGFKISAVYVFAILVPVTFVIVWQATSDAQTPRYVRQHVHGGPRFQVSVGADHVAVMIETQTGRSWVMVKASGGKTYTWRRFAGTRQLMTRTRTPKKETDDSEKPSAKDPDE